MALAPTPHPPMDAWSEAISAVAPWRSWAHLDRILGVGSIALDLAAHRLSLDGFSFELYADHPESDHVLNRRADLS